MKTNIGIYQLLCKPTGQIYIGQSSNLRSREMAYKTSKGHNSLLRKLFALYPREEFYFGVLEYLKRWEDLARKESMWYYSIPKEKLLNINSMFQYHKLARPHNE